MTETAAGPSRGTIINVVLLAFMPAAIAIHYLRPEWSAAVFVCGCIAIIPLAGFMGEATEAIAAKAGSGIGGLLNASFGNAAELILAIAALRAGHSEVVKASLTGSILGNLLLILGLSMFMGGLRYKEQKFNVHAAVSGSSLMLLAVVGLFVPTLFHSLHPEAAEPILRPISLGIAGVLLVLYAASLLFQLRTHAHLYGEAEEDGHEEEEHLPIPRAVIQLVVATIAVAVMSEYLVHAIEGATKTFGFTETFVGVIVLATVGNAAEHSTAITMALKDRMSLSTAIASESSKQIALFVAPVLVLISGFFGQPMSLEFAPFEVAAVGIGVAVATSVSFDGRSNWLEGAMLLGVYVILGIAFFFTP
jgi:Ca2+:H+ antiporter